MYLKLGGFETRTIFNEDMIFAGKVILAGGAVAYCAEARVIHSHNYSGIMQFKRNFDLGISRQTIRRSLRWQSRRKRECGWWDRQRPGC